MINIKLDATYFGASPFAAMPVLVASITLSENTPDFATKLQQGALRLRTDFPEWFNATPSPQQSVAETVAHTATQWALGALNEVRGFLHDAGAEATPEGARLWLGFHHPGVSLSALELALKVLIEAGQSKTFDRHGVDARLTSLWKLCWQHHPDYQARILMEGASVQDIPALPFISGSKYWQYGWGSRSRIFFESMSNADGQIGHQLQRSKILSKVVFNALGFSTPEYLLVNDISELPEKAKTLGWPCVVKPLFSGGGKGVTAGIESISDMETAFVLARRFTKDAVMIEKFVPGDDHRLMVIDGRLFAAIRREPSSVTGDGRSTVVQLLKEVNRFRSSNIVKSRYLRPIAADGILEQHLGQQGVGLNTVLESGRRITLRSNANLSTGGVCIDVTERVHPHVRLMAETIASTMGLGAVGIDYITRDIEKSWSEGGSLIEANTIPSLDVMIAAGQDPVTVASAVLGTLPARIPIQLILIQQSDLEKAVMFLKNLTCTEGFGWACNGVAAIDSMPLRARSTRPWPAVQALLRNKVVNQLLVVCTAEEVIRHGMPVDKVSDVALCGNELPLTPEWLQVLTDHSDTLEKFSSWHEFSKQAFTSLNNPG